MDDTTITAEEIFDPFVSILKFKTDFEVFERANNSIYGLAAGICSSDTARSISVAHQLGAGAIWINSYDKWMRQHLLEVVSNPDTAAIRERLPWTAGFKPSALCFRSRDQKPNRHTETAILWSA
jgi:hypothetical protein